jgi:cell division protein FtsI (penicillin-binding protein 3)
MTASRKLDERAQGGRILLVAGALLTLLGLTALRIGQLTIVDRPELAALARRQHRETVRVVAPRGAIVDRNSEILAETVGAPSIFASPRRYPVGPEALPKLAQALALSPRVVERRLGSQRGFVWLKRHATQAEAEAVERLRLTGVGSIDEGKRLYPQGAIGAHVVGMAGVDLRGLEGIELEYDRWMRGEESIFEVERDGRGRSLFTAGIGAVAQATAGPSSGQAGVAREAAVTLAQLAPGASLELTIDAGLQALVERELAAGVAAADAEAGTAIMLDPQTGAILALANVPSYDPNRPAGVQAAARRNRAVTDSFEPGSTFKAVLTAAAIEEGVVTPQDRVFCENGSYRIGRWTIHDHHPYGLLTVPEVIQVSSNIGASKIGAKLGRERYAEYLERFGFGRRTAIDLPGEVAGVIRPARSWSTIDLATHSFGQGIAVTPIQLAAAYAAIAAGGRLHQPYLVKRATTRTGRVLLERDPTRSELAARQVVTAATAKTVTEMLERVVEVKGGTGDKARIAGVRVAGKTGTAQKVDAATHRYSTGRLASFIGFAPADDPRLVTLVMIDNPKTASYGGVVAAPVFAAITSRALDRLGVDQGPESHSPDLPAPVSVARQSSASAGPATVPSFLGMSLRAALTAASHEGLVVDARGSGFVTAQLPPPGSPRAADENVVLTLEPPV